MLIDHYCLFIVLIISLMKAIAPHQRKRINILLGKEFDPHGAGYNLIQSKIAIGSGGLSERGS